MITVNPNPPVPIITLNWLTLMSSSPTGNQWYLNGSIIPGATSQFYTVTQNGFYTVEVTNNFGCTSMSAPYSYCCIGIAEFNESDNMSIYPNPSDGCFTVKYSVPSLNQNVEIVIYNTLGRIIFHVATIDQKTIIDLSKQPKGIYFVQLRFKNNFTANKKIVIR